jgi:RNase H-like domain found in reverse transcriptase
VLQQRRRGHGWEPLGFFSKKLSADKSQYSAFECELLVVYAALLHFQFLLEGQKFVIFTDHRPLVGAIGRLSDPKSDRQRRHLSFIAEFAADIRHIAGDTNIVADTLSRPACSTRADKPSYADIVRGPPHSGQPAASGSSLVAAASSSSPSPPSTSPPSFWAPEGFPVGEPEGWPVHSVEPPPQGPRQPPPLPFDLLEIAAAQQGCADCQKGAILPTLRVLRMDVGPESLLVECSSSVLRPLVPAAFAGEFLTPCTTLLIQEPEPPAAWSAAGLCGGAWPQTLSSGAEIASSASG